MVMARQFLDHDIADTQLVILTYRIVSELDARKKTRFLVAPEDRLLIGKSPVHA